MNHSGPKPDSKGIKPGQAVQGSQERNNGNPGSIAQSGLGKRDGEKDAAEKGPGNGCNLNRRLVQMNTSCSLNAHTRVIRPLAYMGLSFLSMTSFAGVFSMKCMIVSISAIDQ
jgi:hypothetical protein